MNLTPETIIVVTFLLATAPTILGALTCFLKVSIVLGALKNAIGGQSFPGQFVIFVISTAITWIVMEPVFTEIFENLTKANVEINLKTIPDLDQNLKPLKRFLQRNSGVDEVEFFKKKFNSDENSWRVVISSFITTEIREAFQLALMIYVPFVVIDFIVAAILVSAGMLMLSPMIISLPVKIGLLYIAEPWLKLFDGFIKSY